MREEFCIVCGKRNALGMHILEHMICKQCEQAIVSTDANDAQYALFVQRLQGVAKEAAARS